MCLLGDRLSTAPGALSIETVAYYTKRFLGKGSEREPLLKGSNDEESLPLEPKDPPPPPPAYSEVRISRVEYIRNKAKGGSRRMQSPTSCFAQCLGVGGQSSRSAPSC